MLLDVLELAVGQIVVDGEMDSGRRQEIEHMAADEPRAAGEENAFHVRRKFHDLDFRGRHKPAAISASSERTEATTASRELFSLRAPRLRIVHASSSND